MPSVAGMTTANTEFIRSNSIIAKISFFLLVVLLFVVALRLGMVMLAKLLTPTGDVKLIDGMHDASQLLTIYQNPSIKGSKPIIRSVDEDKGIEFTWSTWLFIKNDAIGTDGKYHHVFHKGNNSVEPNGMSQPNNGPGMYLHYNKKGSDGESVNNSIDLTIAMNTFNNKNEAIAVKNVPVGKWFSVIFTCDGNHVNVHINGVLATRHRLSGVPKQNYGDIYVGLNGGFNGNVSDLRYYNYEVSNFQVNYITSQGPNRKAVGKFMSDKDTTYLSSKWFFAGNRDGYNP